MRPVVPGAGGRLHPPDAGGGDDEEEHRVRSQELEEVAGDLRRRWCDRLPDRVSPVLRSRWRRRRRPVLRRGTCSASDSFCEASHLACGRTLRYCSSPGNVRDPGGKDLSMADDLQEKLDEQLRYYRARAPEYDAWALREGGFDRGPRERAKWFADIAKLERALDRFHPSGHVLELACGTGQWTERLTRYADRLTAVDAAEEVLDLNRRRVGDGVRYIHADMFSWRPTETYDV